MIHARIRVYHVYTPPLKLSVPQNNFLVLTLLTKINPAMIPTARNIVAILASFGFLCFFVDLNFDCMGTNETDPSD